MILYIINYLIIHSLFILIQVIKCIMFKFRISIYRYVYNKQISC